MNKFRLSDPGTPFAQNPAMSEYLRAYDFPLPPEVRYGFTRIDSPQEKDRVSLMAQAWVPAHAVGTIVLIHGYSEHCGNYARLVREFTQSQFAVIAFDHRGHGLSEGPPAHVESPETYAEDAEKIIGEIFPHVLPSRPLFIWGHSLGAMVGLQLILRHNLPVRPRAAVFSSPLLGFPILDGLQKILSGIAPLLAKLLPSLPVAHGIPSDFLSHDEQYLARRHEDPLIKNSTTPKWFESTKQSVAKLQKNAEAFRSLAPTLFLLAGDEKITNLNAARDFAFRAYAGPNHKVIEFPGLYHELEKEPAVRSRVVSESIAWFRLHK